MVIQANLPRLTFCLNRTNYVDWHSHVLLATQAHDLDGFLFGTHTRPKAFISDDELILHVFGGIGSDYNFMNLPIPIFKSLMHRLSTQLLGKISILTSLAISPTLAMEIVKAITLNVALVEVPIVVVEAITQNTNQFAKFVARLAILQSGAKTVLI
ncbi:hypothetical protein TorRG33x02_247680 [Trema orientale]|uniref:Retrotransposon Copia-like N-terminal domain-containing protein n=1 Tax=Trema orientale TaxID=63057 RepID=A0A2P5DLL7_TREOI|nr:hypothetical protein TorRG33x02_247680 [Trema orientale]